MLEKMMDFLSPGLDWSDPVSAGLWWVIVVIVLGTILLVLYGIGYGIFTAIDSWFLTQVSGTGLIIRKEYTPEDRYYNVALKMYTTDPPSWSLVMQINGKQANFDVSEVTFRRFRENQSLPVTYVLGRLSQDLYIKTISA